MNLAEFFIKIGVSGKETVKALDSAVSGTRKAVLGLTAAFAGATFAVNKFVNGTVQNSVAIENFTTQTGLAINELNKWAAAGQKTNSALTFDTVKNNLAGVQKQLEQIKIGQGNVAPFVMAGIDIRGANAFDVLEQLRNNIQGLSNAEAVNIIGMLGLDANFINVLRLTDSEFQKLGQNNFLSGKQIATAAALGRTMNNLKIQLSNLKDQAVVKLAPVLSKMLQDFSKWVAANGKKITETFKTIAEVFTKIGASIGRVAGLLAGLFENLKLSQNGFLALTGIVGILMAAFKPLTLTLLGLFLILEDIAVWAQGGESLFGGLYDAIDKFRNSIGGFPNIALLLGGAGLLAFLGKLGGSMDKLSSKSGGFISKFMKIAGFGALIGILTEMLGGEKEEQTLGSAASNIGQAALAGSLFGAKGALVGAGIGGLMELNKFIPEPRSRGSQVTNNITMSITGDNATEIGNTVRESIENITLESQLLR